MARSGGSKLKHPDGRIEILEEPTRPATTDVDGLPEKERAAAIERHRQAMGAVDVPGIAGRTRRKPARGQIVGGFAEEPPPAAEAPTEQTELKE